MDNNIHSSDEEEKLNEALYKVLPKNDYYISLDSAIKNVSVNVNERLKEQKERKRLFKKRFIGFSPVLAASLCLVIWIVMKDSPQTDAVVSQEAISKSVETATLTTDEFNGMVNDEVRIVLDDLEDFDDPVLLFDSMTSSDVNTTIDELTESI